MAYVDPNTIDNPTTGSAAPAAWGDTVRDDLDWLSTSMPHAKAFNSAAQAFTTGVRAAVTFNSESYDTGGCHSTVSNTSRLTVPTGGGGIYLIIGNLEWAGVNTTGVRQAEIRLNGGATFLAISSTPATNATQQLTVCTHYLLAAGDYVELTGFQNSGGNLNANASTAYSPYLSFHWVAVS